MGLCHVVNYCCQECKEWDCPRHKLVCEKMEVNYIGRSCKIRLRTLDKEREEEVKRQVEKTPSSLTLTLPVADHNLKFVSKEAMINVANSPKQKLQVVRSMYRLLYL